MRMERRAGVRGGFAAIGLVILATGVMTTVALVLAGVVSLLAR
jgi:hypothetical protein